MLCTVTPRPDGRFHVELDWRPNETGIFTREELLQTACTMFDAAGADCLLRCIADALGTAESGDALVEVARNAHRAELDLAERIEKESYL